METWALSTFKDDKIITIAVHCWTDEKIDEVARDILFSLNFDVRADLDEGIIWKSKEEGVAKNGLFVRMKLPAFTFEYPITMKPGKLTPDSGQIFSTNQGVSPFSLQVAISDLGEDGFDTWVKDAGEDWVAALKGLGSSRVKILRTDHIDLYDEYKAVEMEIEWLWTDGSTILTNINHYILKDDKIITLSGTAMGDTDELKAIFETIDLEP